MSDQDEKATLQRVEAVFVVAATPGYERLLIRLEGEAELVDAARTLMDLILPAVNAEPLHELIVRMRRAAEAVETLIRAREEGGER